MASAARRPPGRRWRPVLARGCALFAVAGLVAPAALAQPSPAANVAPVPNFNASCRSLGAAVVAGYCSFDAATGAFTVATPARESAALAALRGGGAGLGLPALRLPSDFEGLAPDQQQFVLVDLERVAEGLPPVVAETPALDAIALQGAEGDADPRPQGAWTAYASASNWAGEAQPAAALYDYLFLDGWGGSRAATPNLDCTGPAAAGCWAHRRAILGSYGASGLMGIGTVAAAGTSTGSSAQIFVAYDGPPVPVAYTWTQALSAGAAGGLPAPTPGDPPPGAQLWPFSDLASAAWSAGAAGTLAALGVARGIGAGAFAPAAPVQLQQFVTLLGRALDWTARPAAAPPGTAAYAAGAMGNAAASGLLPAGSAPAQALTRLQAASLLVRVLDLPPAALPVPLAAGLAPAEAAPLGAAVAAGVLRGTGVGLDPSGILARGQAALLVLRALLGAARAGRGPASARVLPGGAILYHLGAVEALAPSSTVDPTAFWIPAGGAILLQAAGSWWNGTVSWRPEATPSWAAGASAYGEAVAELWPAGGAGTGPALFRTTVGAVTLGGATQVLAPGATTWVAAPSSGAATDPGLVLAAAVAG